MKAEDAIPYQIELQEIYLFPTVVQPALLKEAAEKWEVPLAFVRRHFEAERSVGNWLRASWARRVQPTEPEFHELAPILARVRFGACTPKEVEWLGVRITTAIEWGDHQLLELITKLATKPISTKAANVINQAAFDFYEEHRTIPTFAELRNYVGAARGAKFERYKTLRSVNWSRVRRLSGLEWLDSPECRGDTRDL